MLQVFFSNNFKSWCCKLSFSRDPVILDLKLQLAIKRNCFVDFHNLEELIVENNKLIKIKSNTFQHLNKLKILNLFGNQIEQIETNGFQGLDNLEDLYLNGNKLTKIKFISTFKQTKEIKSFL